MPVVSHPYRALGSGKEERKRNRTGEIDEVGSRERVPVLLRLQERRVQVLTDHVHVQRRHTWHPVQPDAEAAPTRRPVSDELTLLIIHD